MSPFNESLSPDSSNEILKRSHTFYAQCRTQSDILMWGSHSSVDAAADGFWELRSRPVHGSVRYIVTVYESVQVQPLYRLPGPSCHRCLVLEVPSTFQEGLREVHHKCR